MTSNTEVKPALMMGGSKWSLGANLLTIARFVLAPVLAVLVYQQNPWWVTFWLALGLGATDFFDGRMARRGQPTRLGAFLDPLADKVAVLGVAFALVLVDRFWWVPVVIITVREVAIMVYRSYWGRQGLAVPARKSGKHKALVQGLAVAAALLPPLEPYPLVADALLWLAVVFTVVSGVQYLLDGSNALSTTGERQSP